MSFSFIKTPLLVTHDLFWQQVYVCLLISPSRSAIFNWRAIDFLKLSPPGYLSEGTDLFPLILST